MYTEHGITKNREKLGQDIKGGLCRVWFGVKNGKAVASAALVIQADGSVEVGRAVSFENGVGGFLMLSAAMKHLTSSPMPLVAEVRISDQFLGIPSGEATETICIKHMGLIPHALVPAFNHGRPVRQEQFLFASSRTISQSESMVIPDDRKAIELLGITAVALVSERFHPAMDLNITKRGTENTAWEIVMQNPFVLAIPKKGSGSKLETAVRHAKLESPFMMIQIETTPGLSGTILECLNSGFIPCGIERNPGQEGHPVLILGKLREDTLLAPCKINNGIITPKESAAICNIDSLFRSNTKV